MLNYVSTLAALLTFYLIWALTYPIVAQWHFLAMFQ